MKGDLRELHLNLRLYTLILVPILLLLTTIFFYFYFIIPEKESDVLFNFPIRADIELRTVEVRLSTLEQIHEEKVGGAVIVASEVRDVFGGIGPGSITE